MRIEINSECVLTGLNSVIQESIEQAMSFPNPQWAENERRGFSNYRTPKIVRGFKRTSGGLLIPRGAVGLLIHLARQAGERIEIVDRRRTLPEVDFEFRGALRDYQERAVADVLRRDFGTLVAPTGSGKTTMALAIIAARRQPALIVVHTRELAEQWRQRAAEFLGLDKGEIGQIGNGKFRIGERLTIALVQSLYERAQEVSEHVGFLVIDECHHCPSRTFSEAVQAFDCRFMLGLSATPYRRDGLGRLISWYIGPVVHKIDQGGLVDQGALVRAEVEQVRTDFWTDTDASIYYGKVLSELTEDEGRNRLIADTVVRQAKNGGGLILVLSDRKQHCETLRALLERSGIDAVTLTGDLATGKRKEIVERMQSGQVRVVCGTGSLLGEGFDMPSVETLAIATPIKFSGRLIQFVGRALRPARGKSTARIIDFVDAGNPVLRAGARSRLRAFERMPGITVHG